MRRFSDAEINAALAAVDAAPSDPVARLEHLGLPGQRVMRYARIQAGNVSEILRDQLVSPQDAYALGWLDALAIGLTLTDQREGNE